MIDVFQPSLGAEELERIKGVLNPIGWARGKSTGNLRRALPAI